MQLFFLYFFPKTTICSYYFKCVTLTNFKMYCSVKKYFQEKKLTIITCDVLLFKCFKKHFKAYCDCLLSKETIFELCYL